VAVVDPHGELIDRVIKYIPKERINDVIYFNPADRDYPIAFNPLEATIDMREEIVNGFVAVLKKLFGYSWGPRLEYVLKHSVSALVEVEGSTMLGIVRLLTDRNYRKKIVGQVTDPVVQMFWLKEFASYNDKMATETISPILNKVGQFTASPIIRNIVGQPKSQIDFAKVMNEQKILLVDLSTGKIGEANSELLGSMIITKLQQAAMTRAFIPESKRKDFYLYVDEFQNFATESFAVILSEARKYRLSLTVANQYIAQMDETVRDAVFGNVGTLITFRVGATDAAFLEKEFTPVFEQNDLVNLDNRHIYLNMLIDGVTSVPFSAITLDSPQIGENFSAIIAAVSREKYGTPKEKIEESIRDWYKVDSVIAGVNANEKDNPIVVPTKPERREERKREIGPAEKSTSNNELKKAINEALGEKDRAETKKMETIEVKKEPVKEIESSDDSVGPMTPTVVSDLSESPTKSVGKERPREEAKRTDADIGSVKTPRESVSVAEEKKYKKIDKKTLKEIIREVTRPGGESKKSSFMISRPKNIPEHKSSAKDDEINFRAKEIKEITPEEFHQLKTIHPHEKIKIKKEVQEIKPGEVVKF
jgi:hypothetical protein